MGRNPAENGLCGLSSLVQPRLLIFFSSTKMVCTQEDGSRTINIGNNQKALCITFASSELVIRRVQFQLHAFNKDIDAYVSLIALQRDQLAVSVPRAHFCINPFGGRLLASHIDLGMHQVFSSSSPHHA